MTYTPEEQEFIDWMESLNGPMTPQQKHFALLQARMIGNMDERTEAEVKQFGEF